MRAVLNRNLSILRLYQSKKVRTDGKLYMNTTALTGRVEDFDTPYCTASALCLTLFQLYSLGLPVAPDKNQGSFFACKRNGQGGPFGLLP